MTVESIKKEFNKQDLCVLKEVTEGGWYGGPSEKYADVFNMTSGRDFAVVMPSKEGLRLQKIYNSRGYKFELEPVFIEE